MLIKTGDGWNFESELALENVVSDHLEALLSLQLLRRQYQCRGEICDLTASDSAHRLVIVELKNVEDRYIVQQLTRYYDALSQEQPWAERIDYSQPARLIAIAPSFHRHNFIDRKYNALDIEFFTFEVIRDAEDQFGLKLSSVETSAQTAIPLSFSEVKVPVIEGLPVPPQRLIDAIGSLPVEGQQNLFNLRHQILSFDSRIQEVITPQSIGYGRGAKNWCVEFYFHRRQSTPILFLWLPLWRRRGLAIGRHRIWTDWAEVLYHSHAPTGLGKARPKAEWEQIPREKWPRQQVEGGGRNLVAYSFAEGTATRLGCKDASTSLIALTDVALSQWQARL